GKSTGTWRSISHQDHATNEPVTQDIFTLGIDHGTRPRNATYAYVVLPAASESETKRYVQYPSIAVVSNTRDLQAVSHEKRGIHYAVFYKPGSVDFPGGLRLTSDKAALFLIKFTPEEGVRITLADPTRKLDSVTFRLELASGTATTLTVQLPQGTLAGKSLLLDTIHHS